MSRSSSAGMTLVEVLVALAVFAVIGTAAFAMLDQTLRSERAATARLERLIAIQRTFRILAIDTMQVIPGSVTSDRTGVGFLRRGTIQDGSVHDVDGLRVHYAWDGTQLVREIGAPGTDPSKQILLGDVRSAEWHFIKSGDALPPDVPADQADGIDLVFGLPGEQILRGLFPIPHDMSVP